MAVDLNEFADPAHSDADVRKILLDIMREVFKEKGYEGEALENKIREKLSRPPSPKLVKILKDSREKWEKANEYYNILKQQSYEESEVLDKIKEMLSKTRIN